MPHFNPVFAYRIMLARHATLYQLEASQDFAWSFQLLLEQRVPADELFFQAQGEPQTGFYRRQPGVDLVPVERHAGFEAQAVTRRQADRFYTFRSGRLKDALPHLKRLFGRHENLKTIL